MVPLAYALSSTRRGHYQHFWNALDTTRQVVSRVVYAVLLLEFRLRDSALDRPVVEQSAFPSSAQTGNDGT